MFLCENQWKFERFQYFNFGTNFLENENLFQKTGVPVFSWKSWKKHYFYTKLPYQISMLRKIEWWVQNNPIAKNEVLPVTTLFFLKILFQFKNLLEKLIWCTNAPNIHIHTFRKRWSLPWGCFYLWVSLILNNTSFAKWIPREILFSGNIFSITLFQPKITSMFQ